MQQQQLQTPSNQQKQSQNPSEYYSNSIEKVMQHSPYMKGVKNQAYKNPNFAPSTIFQEMGGSQKKQHNGMEIQQDQQQVQKEQSSKSNQIQIPVPTVIALQSKFNIKKDVKNNYMNQVSDQNNEVGRKINFPLKKIQNGQFLVEVKNQYSKKDFISCTPQHSQTKFYDNKQFTSAKSKYEEMSNKKLDYYFNQQYHSASPHADIQKLYDYYCSDYNSQNAQQQNKQVQTNSAQKSPVKPENLPQSIQPFENNGTNLNNVENQQKHLQVKDQTPKTPVKSLKIDTFNQQQNNSLEKEALQFKSTQNLQSVFQDNQSGLPSSQQQQLIQSQQQEQQQEQSQQNSQQQLQPELQEKQQSGEKEFQMQQQLNEKVLCLNCFNKNMSQQKREQELMQKQLDLEFERKNSEQNKHVLDQNRKNQQQYIQDLREYLQSQMRESEQLKLEKQKEMLEIKQKYQELQKYNQQQLLEKQEKQKKEEQISYYNELQNQIKQQQERKKQQSEMDTVSQNYLIKPDQKKMQLEQEFRQKMIQNHNQELLKQIHEKEQAFKIEREKDKEFQQHLQNIKKEREEQARQQYVQFQMEQTEIQKENLKKYEEKKNNEKQQKEVEKQSMTQQNQATLSQLAKDQQKYLLRQKQQKEGFSKQLEDQIKCQRELQQLEKQAQQQYDHKLSESLQQLAKDREKYLSQLLRCYQCKRQIKDQ